jgi:murein DD-endopeptidase MepM/ murein hydrolase activator NlpD
MPPRTVRRGATPLSQTATVSRGHLIAVAALTGAVALGALIAPGGDVEANRPETLTASPETAAVADAPRPEAATGSTPAAETPAADAGAVSAEPRTEKNAWRELIVQSGDNLSLIFKRAGYGDADVYRIIHTAPQGKGLERIYPGQTIAFQADAEGELAAVKHRVDPLRSVVYRRMDGGYSSERIELEPEVRLAWTSGEIESSLFLAGRDAGLSSNLVMELANVFGGVIDFVLDPRRGDTMQVLYEELYLDGEKFDDGSIVAASFTNRGETFNAFRYVDSAGMESYYNEEGVSMRKAFLMAPVDFTRISSNFNLKRLHPIYKTTRPHRGTDYAAPHGTPVFASGDGRVIEAGYTRANGNYIFIQHGERYITKYLHLQRKKVGKGQRVVQSQVIGTVGATGAATGPHLHYEFLVDGVHRSPRTIHKLLPKARSLAAGEMPRFQASIAPLGQQLAQLRTGTRLALSDDIDLDENELNAP